MRKNILMTFVLASILALSGCSTDTDYGEFTLIEDSESAETIFDDYKLKNENVADVKGIESEYEINGTYVNDDNETISINTTGTTKTGLDGTRYAYDEIINSINGTFTSYTRFSETSNKYYTYSALDFSYEDNDVKTVVNSNTMVEDTSMNENPLKIYTAEDITLKIGTLHDLASMTYSEDMNIYTSDKGYMKYEQTNSFSGIPENGIVNESGYLVKREAWIDDNKIELKNTYSAEFKDIDTDDYEKRDDAYLYDFSQSYVKFLSLTNPGY